MTASVNPNKFEYFTSLLSHGKHHLIAVDAELTDLDVLLADLEPKCSVLVIERHQDAIALITQILALFAQSNMAAESLVIWVR